MEEASFLQVSMTFPVKDIVSCSASSGVLPFRGCDSADCGLLVFDTMHHNLHFCGFVKKYWTSGSLNIGSLRCFETSGHIQRRGVLSQQVGCLNANDIPVSRWAFFVFATVVLRRTSPLTLYFIFSSHFNPQATNVIYIYIYIYIYICIWSTYS